MNPSVSHLFIYPIKSAAGTAVTALALDQLAAEYDRRWMLVDAGGKFITQRERGTLALIRPALQPNGLLLHADGMAPLAVMTPGMEVVSSRAIVWDDTVDVRDAGNAAAEWCSRVVGTTCRLVAISPNADRPLHPKYAGSVNPVNRQVALSDGAPLLIVSDAALTLLNGKLAIRGIAPVSMDRFRPNVVLAGTEAHEEDTWLTIRIGATTFGVGSPCPRCVITTIDQHTGRRAPQRSDEPGGEPLRSLAQYRRQGSGVMFGMNVTHERAGVVKIGDSVDVLALR